MTPKRKALLVAPLVVPLLACAPFAVAMGGARFPFAFVALFVPAAIFSYAVTILVFLPALWVLSWVARPSVLLTCVTGGVLGVAAWVPVSFFMWQSSGVDSGPPAGPWSDDLRDDYTDPLLWVFAFAGLATAAVYWRLARPGPGV
jgi:hypothetical protein